MPVNFTNHITNRRTTPQSEPIPGEQQVKNNAGGYVYSVSKWDRLTRFLILGTDGGTYYVKERELTRDNAAVVEACLLEDYARTVAEIVAVSDAGRAPKNDQAIFALALAAADARTYVRLLALSQLPKVCRIPTHLFHFMQYSKALRGISRGFRRAIADWYARWTSEQLAYELVKYQARDGWSHRDVLRQAHVTPRSAHQAALRWAIGAPLGERTVARPNGSTLAPRTYPAVGDLPEIIQAFEAAKVSDPKEVCRLIRAHGLTREMIPTSMLNDVTVWEALLEKMPLTAMIRNLGKMTAVELLKPLSAASKLIATRLSDDEALRKSRVHPLAILNALRVYQQGRGDKGKLTWTPVRQVVDALDAAFYASFKNVEPTGKNILLALDVSGSMSASIAGTGLSCREACAALALVTANVEPNYAIVGFTSNRSRWAGYQNGISELSISPKQRLDDVVRYMTDLDFGGTDCALPMIYATELKLDIDAFCVYTDSETWAGAIHPKQALAKYRVAQGKPQAKQIVVGMTATEFTIADPADPLTLDVVGFDTMTPAAIAEFVRG